MKISVNIGEGYHDPIAFVECAMVAEEYAFDTVWFGDHLMPWTHSQDRSAYAWSVMPIALDRTRNIRVGPVVTSPIGGRYHPMIIAQASATLDNMYAGRFSLGVGSGEAVSEAMFFREWPNWQERTERLAEAVVLIKKLWESKDYFTFEGKYFTVKNTFLYTKPKTRIPIYFSAIGKNAAEYAGTYGDHLVTINTPQKCRDVIFPIFESSARKAGKDPTRMEKMVEIFLYFGDKDHGIQEVKTSGEAGVLAPSVVNERDPKRIEQMSSLVDDSVIKSQIYFVSSPDELIGYIDEYRKAGATHLELLTNSFPDKIRFIGEKVLPYFTEERGR